MREAVRSELAQRGGVRRYIDALKKQTFVVDPARGRQSPTRRSAKP